MICTYLITCFQVVKLFLLHDVLHIPLFSWRPRDWWSRTCSSRYKRLRTACPPFTPFWRNGEVMWHRMPRFRAVHCTRSRLSYRRSTVLASRRIYERTPKVKHFAYPFFTIGRSCPGILWTRASPSDRWNHSRPPIWPENLCWKREDAKAYPRTYPSTSSLMILCCSSWPDRMYC